jgi:hypothetical protein
VVNGTALLDADRPGCDQGAPPDREVDIIIAPFASRTARGVVADTWTMLPEDRDPDTITDKDAYERAVADDLAAKLKAFDPEKGDYAITVVGSYPGTKLQVNGRNIRTGQLTDWEFALWEFLSAPGTPEDTATILYAQMAV